MQERGRGGRKSRSSEIDIAIVFDDAIAVAVCWITFRIIRHNDMLEVLVLVLLLTVLCGWQVQTAVHR